MPKETDNDNSAGSDRACALCREKKIRCGREKPKCGNCKRQKWRCDYSAPEKRVSHIKLLSENVNSIDARLGNIETEIFRLTRIQTAPRSRHGSESTPVSTGSPFNPSDAEDESPCQLLTTDRQLLHSPITDSYYGPDTFYAWATAFKELVVSKRRTLRNSSIDHANGTDLGLGDELDPVNHDLSELLRHAERKDTLYDTSVTDSSIMLPPKQFLPMFHTRFFHQNDWSTDLFVQERFWEHVDRVYSSYNPGLDEPWAIVFNTIILLSMSAEGSFQAHGPLSSSQFAAPFFSALRISLNKVYLLMAPRLINVQALALLSLAAEQFHPFGVAEAVFVQACNLARRMGLNQIDMTGTRDTIEEEERLKVSRSLYIRDKSLGISRGTICWLPGFEVQKMKFDDLGTAEGRYHAARVTITAFQERVYRLHSSSGAQGDYANKAGFHPSGVQHGLADLLEIGTMCGPHLELWLEFLATRIVALRRNTKANHAKRTLQDCRACCILLLMAFRKSDQTLRQRLELHCDLQAQSQRNSESPSPDTEIGLNEQVISMPRTLLSLFPVSTLFLLAANVIQPATPDEEAHTNEDYELLIRVCECYQEADASMQVINRAQQVGKALQRLLSIIHHVRGLNGSSLSSQSAAASSRCHSGSVSSTQLEPTRSFTDLSPLHHVSSSGFINSHQFADGAPPISSLGVNDIEAFIMNTPSGAELGSAFSMDNDMMSFMRQDAMGPNQFASEAYGMDVCYPNEIPSRTVG